MMKKILIVCLFASINAQAFPIGSDKGFPYKITLKKPPTVKTRNPAKGPIPASQISKEQLEAMKKRHKERKEAREAKAVEDALNAPVEEANDQIAKDH